MNDKIVILIMITIIIMMICKKESFSNGNVLLLHPGNFDKTIAGDYLVIVKFFAPWCPHCTKMVSDWKDLANTYKDDKSVVIADVNADEFKELGQREGVSGFPTIKLYKGGRQLGDYKGPRDKGTMKQVIDGAK